MQRSKISSPARHDHSRISLRQLLGGRLQRSTNNLRKKPNHKLYAASVSSYSALIFHASRLLRMFTSDQTLIFHRTAFQQFEMSPQNTMLTTVTLQYLSNATGRARHNVRLSGEILRQVVSRTRLCRAACK